VGNDMKVEKSLQGYDDDAKVTIDYLVGLETCNGRIGATGEIPYWCWGINRRDVSGWTSRISRCV
jgi:hypothetical protein